VCKIFRKVFYVKFTYNLINCTGTRIQ